MSFDIWESIASTFTGATGSREFLTLVVLLLLVTMATSTASAFASSSSSSAGARSQPPTMTLGGGKDKRTEQQQQRRIDPLFRNLARRAKSATGYNAAVSTASAVLSRHRKALWDEGLAPLWDDLAPPFSMDGEAVRDMVREEEELRRARWEEEDADLLETMARYDVRREEQEEEVAVVEDEDGFHDGETDVTHFCFLVHGHRGLSKDLSYLQSVMTDLAHQKKRDSILSSGNNEDDSPSTSPSRDTSEQQQVPQNCLPRHDIIVHNAVCNEYRTMDGIENGGERLVEEMLDVIRTEMDRQEKRRRRHRRRRQREGLDQEEKKEEEEEGLRDVTISVVGNSLGGIYSRYAIAKLAELSTSSSFSNDAGEENGAAGSSDVDERSNEEEEGWFVIDGKYRIHYNVFCTTATPHLGVSQHTFVPLPRTAEIGIAHSMGPTGRDLFRLNDLFRTMATSPRFLEPLGSFRKRIAYANAHRTDFPVPAETAAFLCPESRYPHHFADDIDGDDDDGFAIDENGLIVATLHTKPRSRASSSSERTTRKRRRSDGAEADTEEEHAGDDELVQMSTSLDSLGWKKVFVDVRGEIPIGVSIPRRLRKSLIGGSNEQEEEEDSSTSATTCPVQDLRRRRVVESRDVATAVTATDHRLYFPMGHNMICAFSRSRFTTLLNRGGRPVVDSLARELVEDILKWNGPQ